MLQLRSFPPPYRGLRQKQREERPIEWLLKWAFRDQQVDLGQGMPRLEPSRSATANVCDILELQAIVQGGSGGASEPEDAIIIAAHVQRLHWHPRMLVVTYARAGRRPDPQIGARPKLVPAEWHTNRWGTFPKVEPIGPAEIGEDGKAIRDAKGQTQRAVGCRLAWDPSPADISRARRRYTEWYGAVRDICYSLRAEQPLTKWTVVRALPPVQPWRAIR